MPLRRSEQWFQNQEAAMPGELPSSKAVEAATEIAPNFIPFSTMERMLKAAYAVDVETICAELQVAREENIAEVKQLVNKLDLVQRQLATAQAEIERLKASSEQRSPTES